MTKMNHPTLRLAQAATPAMVELRRDLHQRPEISGGESLTAGRIAGVLERLGLEVRAGVGGHGVVALLHGGVPGPTVALRSDMDALPVQEPESRPGRSQTPGVMHACGHDGHMAMLVGAAITLVRLRPQLHGDVKLLFQPAEEVIGGARRMIEDGVLRSPDVAAVFGIHLWPQIDFGRVGVRIGPLLSGADHFTLRLVGRGGHGASPHLAADPLPPANVIYQAFQTIRRNINALEPFVLSVCSFHGGTAYNIVPPEVEMRGTLRALDDGVRSAVAARMRGIVSGVAAAFEIEATLSLDISCPVLSPDADKMRLMTAAADKLGLPVQEVQPSMGSEDFAFYAREVPSAFVFLGTREEGRSAPLHSPQFDFNEAVLPLGAALLAQTALDALSAETAQS